MSQYEFLIYIPSEIIIDILSRLPVRSIITCKCVCKSWLDLLNSSEFSKSHLSKSKSGLVVYSRERHSELFKIFEYEDSLDNLESHELHYNPVTKFDRRAFISHLYAAVGIQGSTNGLLFLREINTQPNALYICNPITRDYIELPSPERNVYRYPDIVTFGFGVSKMSGKHKVVRIFHDCIRDETHRLISIPKSICQVYTLGTGSWRSIAPGAPMQYSCRSIGAFLNGNLHWLVTDLNGSHRISCFDLQTELFSTLSPPFEFQRSGRFLCGLVALGDCLCLSDNSSEDKIVIWLMKDYGVERSWTKQFVISKISGFAGESYEVVYPIKVFKDGDILMAWQEFYLFYYSNKTKSLSMFDKFELQNPDCLKAMPYTPSLLSLKSFLMEKAKSF